VAIRYTHYPSVDLYLDEHGMREIPYSLLSYCVVDLVSIIIGNYNAARGPSGASGNL